MDSIVAGFAFSYIEKVGDLRKQIISYKENVDFRIFPTF